MEPKVCVIMPCYNGEKFIGEAIESVLNQTYKNWELIIVDDGSTDNSKEVIKRYFNDHRIKYIAHKENRGIPAARNTGIKASKGEYIAFLDQDDIWLPEKLKEQIETFNMGGDQETGLVFSDIMHLIGDETIRPEWPSKYVPNNLRIKSKEEVLKSLFLQNFIPSISVIVRKDCFDRLGLLNENITGGADDYDFWLRISGHFKIIYINKPFVKKRIHENNYSNMEGFFKDGLHISNMAIKLYPFLAKYSNKKKGRLYYNYGRYLQKIGESSKSKEAIQIAILYDHWQLKYYVVYLLCHFGSPGGWILTKLSHFKSITNAAKSKLYEISKKSNLYL